MLQFIATKYARRLPTLLQNTELSGFNRVKHKLGDTAIVSGKGTAWRLKSRLLTAKPFGLILSPKGFALRSRDFSRQAIISSQRWFNLRLWCASRRQLKTHKQYQYTGKNRQILQGGTQGT